MIQIYAPGNRNYSRNGDAVLHPSQCDVEMNLKGDWQLTLESPADENINLITKEAVIKCDTPIGKDQRFRIYDYEKSEDGVSAKARPVFFDAAKDAFILDKRPTNKTGKDALSILMEGTGYTGETDIMDFNTAYYVRKNLIEAINGEDENSFINRWGGEPIYQNEHLIMNKKYGSDKGAKATFGNNLQSITETVNMDQVVIRIIPMAYNGYMLEGDKPWVDSPNIGKYELIYTKVIEYSDVKLQEDVSDENEKGYADLPTLRAELKRRAQQDFDNGIDLPTVVYEVEVTDLENAVGYEDIKDLVKIGFGDDVKAENKRLNITTKNRCIGIVYDCIEQKNKSVTLGENQTDYFSQMSSVQQKVNQSLTNTGVRGEMVYGLIDLVKASMKATAENAVLQKSKAILFEDKVEESPSYGAMALGTTGFMIAAQRLPDDSDWDWRTFGTGQGFFADLIVAGTMLADRIRGGILESQNYKDGESGFRLDLNNGIIEAVQLLIKTAAEGRVERGFKFEDGALKILGTNEEVVASIHCTWSYPDGPDGIPSGWLDRVAFTYGEPRDNYSGGFWVDNGGNHWCGAKARGMQFEADDMMELSAPKITMNESETKTGRIEFSDGTYIDIVNGVVVGGNAKAGAF